VRKLVEVVDAHPNLAVVVLVVAMVLLAYYTVGQLQLH
jgi:hypothetical protein